MKEVTIKYYILYDSNFSIYWKKQNCRDSKQISMCQVSIAWGWG